MQKLQQEMKLQVEMNAMVFNNVEMLQKQVVSANAALAVQKQRKQLLSEEMKILTLKRTEQLQEKVQLESRVQAMQVKCDRQNKVTNAIKDNIRKMKAEPQILKTWKK